MKIDNIIRIIQTALIAGVSAFAISVVVGGHWWGTPAPPPPPPPTTDVAGVAGVAHQVVTLARGQMATNERIAYLKNSCEVELRTLDRVAQLLTR